MDEKFKRMCDLILEWFTEATYQGMGGALKNEKMQAVAEVAAACIKAAGAN